MNAVFGPKAPKKACNISINEDLLREAKAKAWAEENKDAIGAYNRYVAEHGVWSDGLRAF